MTTHPPPPGHAAVVSAELEAPYVGLRPYEEDEYALFFGREREATVLEDKIFAGPLTVLFAPSGTGKSSLLRARVIPGLRKLEAHVAYFDDWTAAPVPAIRRAVAAVLGMENAGDDEKSLLDLARVANDKTGQGLVVILDQLEQFFLRHADQVGALGSEIGALVRSGPDVHVVLALREEYLGRIEVFREHLLTVMQARHRLEPLEGDAARDAIREPLRLFKSSIEDALVEALLVDLREQGEAAGLVEGAAGTAGVSLPFLQIVCRHLWDATAGEADRPLTAALYERLGRRHGIVEAYVREAMQGLADAERLDLAHVLDLLAPKAGVKMAYPIDVLAMQVGLDRTRLDTLLDHLDRQRIVRRRDVGGTVALYHDAFTDVLRGFIAEQLRAEEAAAQAKKRSLAQKQRSRRISLVVVAIAAALLCVVGGLVAAKMQEVSRRMNTLRKDLRSVDCTEIARSTRELRAQANREPSFWEWIGRWSREDIRALIFDELRHNPNAAACHGPRRLASEFGNSSTSPLVLLYNDQSGTPGPAGEKASGQRIQREVIRAVWQRLAERLWDEKQIRLPPSIDVMVSRELPAGSFALKVDDRIMVRRSIPQMHDRVAVLVLSPPATIEAESRAMAEQTEFKRDPLPSFSDRSVFFGIAQSWSAPLWHVIEGQIALDIPTAGRAHAGLRAALAARPEAGPFTLEILPGLEAAMAVEAFKSVAAQPKLYITETLTKALIYLRQQSEPCLVYAAIDPFDTCKVEAIDKEKTEETRQAKVKECRTAAFERMLPRVHIALVEVVRENRSSGMLTRILDRMADLPADAPEANPREIAKWVLQDDGRARPPETIILSGRRQRGWGCPAAEIKFPDAHWDMANTLDYEEKPVRVRLGAPLADSLAPDSLLLPDVLEALYQTRRDLNQRYGINSPGVRFTGEVWPNDRYRIDVLGKKEQPSGTAQSYAPIGATLNSVLEETRMASVTVDTTVDPFELQRLQRMYLYGWFEPRFSRNDVKLLLRGILAPDGDATGQAPKERAIHHRLPWLLGSLPFWTQTCEKKEDGNCLVRHLRELQKARLAAPTLEGEPPAAIVKGIEALDRDSPDEAVRLFATALRGAKENAERGFLAAYSARADMLVRKPAENLCIVPTPGSRDPWGSNDQTKRAAIEDALALKEVQNNKAQTADFQLCALMYQLPTDDGAVDARKIRKFLDEHGQHRDRWTAEQLYWLGYHFVDANSRTRIPQKADRQTAQDLLLAAFGSEKNPKGLGDLSSRADRAFEKLLDICVKSKKERCFWDLADIAEKAELGVNPLWLLAGNLLGLTTSGTAARQERIQRFLERASGKIGDIHAPAERPYWSMVFDLERLQTDANLGWYRKKDAGKLLDTIEAKRIEIAKLAKVDPKRWESLDQRALILKREALEYQGRIEEGARVDEELRKRFPEDQSMRHWEIRTAIERNRIETAVQLADKLVAEREWKDEETLFLSALAHLLLNDDQDFARSAEQMLLWVDHQYRDYIRLMLWWRLTQRGRVDDARRLLEDRLREIPSNETPEQRFAEGELGPWREMLVRYYLEPNDENRRKIFDPLKDETTFNADPLASAGQPFASFRCEAFFYDALLQSVTGDGHTRKERETKQLEAVISEQCFATYEFSMAGYLLKQSGSP